MAFDLKPINSNPVNPKHKSSVNPFSDTILGEWKFDKKASAGKTFWWTRTAEINLAEVYAQDYIDPESKKNMKIFGEVKLVQKKSVDKDTSHLSMFNTIEPTEKSVIKEIIV